MLIRGVNIYVSESRGWLFIVRIRLYYFWRIIVKKKKYYESSSYPKLNPNEEGKNLAECVSRLIELTVQCTDVVVPRLATRRIHVRNFESPPITWKFHHDITVPRHSHDRRTFFKKVKDERTFDDVGSEEIRKRGNVHADVERTTTAVPLAICRSKEIRTAGSQVPTTRHVSLYLTVPFDSRYHRKRWIFAYDRSSIDRMIFQSNPPRFIYIYIYIVDFYFAPLLIGEELDSWKYYRIWIVIHCMYDHIFQSWYNVNYRICIFLIIISLLFY